MFNNYDGFEWDAANEAHVGESGHAVNLDEIEEVFFNDPLINLSRIEANDERRYLAIGQTDAGRYITAIYTPRNGKIRVITAYDSPQRHKDIYKKQERR